MSVIVSQSASHFFNNESDSQFDSQSVSQLPNSAAGTCGTAATHKETMSYQKFRLHMGASLERDRPRSALAFGFGFAVAFAFAFRFAVAFGAAAAGVRSWASN